MLGKGEHLAGDSARAKTKMVLVYGLGCFSSTGAAVEGGWDLGAYAEYHDDAHVSSSVFI